jgi:hypothetical protein
VFDEVVGRLEEGLLASLKWEFVHQVEVVEYSQVAVEWWMADVKVNFKVPVPGVIPLSCSKHNHGWRSPLHDRRFFWLPPLGSKFQTKRRMNT